ncbi:mitochondrial 2-oxoglutarate/malate carrier protein [Planococcus citri]|uniref:mitochondrial 2-oxoglutarate/malate carrier protein n=1 Tax=Planococcus citri TaxID=170843 RepID=UPI0031F83D38
MSEQQIPNYLKFAFGGLSGMGATCVVQPLDLVKNRMQLSGAGGKQKEYKTSFHMIRAIIKNEGFFAMYNGLSAGLLRQATYTTTRLGMYTWLFAKCTGDGQKSPNFAVKAGLGMLAGMCGAFVGTPAEVALVRMTADGRLPEAERRNYKSVVDALTKITKQEGVFQLWRGAIPTMGRSMVVNGAQLASYSQAKEFLMSTGYFKDNIMCHFTSSMISGLITTAASMPVDIAKTRIQNMKIIDGKPEYTGTVDVLKKILKNEGVFALWKGFTPYYARLGPHTVLTFIILEQLTGSYYKFVLGDKTGRGSGL